MVASNAALAHLLQRTRAECFRDNLDTPRTIEAGSLDRPDE
ncbi:MAG: hypothetical protein AB2L14_11930 [Candidatus Xenobiia bacterium LiM19]